MALVLTNWLGEKGIEKAIELVSSGAGALDAVEAATRIIEADKDILFVARGGHPNALGQMQLDAGVMNGETLEVGTVGALTVTPYALSVARKVMEKLPHVTLVGEGADRFAKECSFEAEDLLTSKISKEFKAWQVDKAISNESDLIDVVWPKEENPHAHRDTVIFIVLDQANNFAVGSSTSGWPYKYPGRLGDSPICGAGFYADNRYGACACTCTGELTIRSGAARAAVSYLKKGANAEEACEEVVLEIKEISKGFIGDVCVHVV